MIPLVSNQSQIGLGISFQHSLLRRPIYRRLDLVDAKHLKLFRRPLWLPELPLLERLPQANKLPLLEGSLRPTSSDIKISLLAQFLPPSEISRFSNLPAPSL